ncbi:MAG: NAD(P)H-binding protein [Gammaproteobacteria bacterium]|nr:NAD(P)H-binding protein [Gammaproteobacteria bacterium]MDP6695242.1 NAD(P)H-binding protein [Gammaproteobacteria bacterium]
MEALILGSTGPTGVMLVNRLCAAGHSVSVIHRSDTRRAEFEGMGARVIRGDAFDREGYVAAIKEAAKPGAIVINLLGGNPFNAPDTWPDYEGNVNAIDGATAAGLSRFILVTSVGTGKSWQFVPGEAYIRPILELKSRAEEHLKETALDWTIIKPGGLGPPDYRIKRGNPLITENYGVRGLIDREDLADVILRVLFDESGTTIHKELYVVVDRIEHHAGEPVPFPLAELPAGL